jgi:hypothetical protein
VQAVAAEGELLRLLSIHGAEVVEVHGAFVGHGDDAQVAWNAFKAVAAIRADEPFQDNPGETCHVDVVSDGDLLLYETGVSERRPEKGWRSEGEPPEPDAYVMDFTRQFTFQDADGEYLGMNGLTLTVEFEPHPELTRLKEAQIWGCGGPPWDEELWSRRGEEPRPFAAAQEWIDEVERSKPFVLAFGRHRAARYVVQQGDY